ARVRLRRLVALAGAIRGGDHAQSPAADPSRPVADADPWDYRRDRHREGQRWERQWIDRVVRPAGPPPAEDGENTEDGALTALLTSCGMAAMTTVVALLERETGDGPIVVDRSTYHETRHVLATGALARRVHEVASDEVPAAAAELGAAAVVVDAVANAADLRVADLAGVAGVLDRLDRREDGPPPLLVVDASVCSMAAEPVRRLVACTPRARVGGRRRTIVVESLTKHAQLG